MFCSLMWLSFWELKGFLRWGKSGGCSWERQLALGGWECGQALLGSEPTCGPGDPITHHPSPRDGTAQKCWDFPACWTLSWVLFTSREILQSTINSSNLQMSKLKFRLPGWLSDKECMCQCRRHGFDSWVRKISWRRKLQSTPVFLPGKSHGQKSLAGYSL